MRIYEKKTIKLPFGQRSVEPYPIEDETDSIFKLCIHAQQLGHKPVTDSKTQPRST